MTIIGDSSELKIVDNRQLEYVIGYIDDYRGMNWKKVCFHIGRK